MRNFTVLSIADDAPANLVRGDAFLVSDNPQGRFLNYPNHIAECAGYDSLSSQAGFIFHKLTLGDYITVCSTKDTYQYTITGIVKAGLSAILQEQ